MGGLQTICGGEGKGKGERRKGKGMCELESRREGRSRVENEAHESTENRWKLKKGWSASIYWDEPDIKKNERVDSDAFSFIALP